MKMVLRPAAKTDARNLFNWRNDTVTLQSSRNGDPVAWHDHVDWLLACLKSSNRKLFIAEIEGQPVGTARLEYYDHGCELSWTVAPEYRGKGFGTGIVRLAIDRAEAVDLIAKIKPENESSARIARCLGFFKTVSHDGLVVWKYTKGRRGSFSEHN